MTSPPPPPLDRHRVVPSPQARERGGLASFMSSHERKGDWEMPRHLRIACIMGSAIVDLREARIPEGRSEIDLRVILGSVELLFPPGVRVEMEVDGFASSVEFTPDASVVPDPWAPVIRVVGTVTLGSVEGASRLAGESAREARKRIRAASGRPSRGLGW